MSKITLSLTSLIVLTLLTGCTQKAAYNQTDNSQAAVSPTVFSSPVATPALSEKKMAQLTGYTFKLAAIKNSGREGWVTVEQGGEFGLEVRIQYLNNKIATTAAEPALISSGTCPKPSETALHNLIDVTNGQSKTTIDSSFEELEKKLPLAVSVRKSAKDKTLIACGAIELNQGALMRYDQTVGKAPTPTQ